MKFSASSRFIYLLTIEFACSDYLPEVHRDLVKQVKNSPSSQPFPNGTYIFKRTNAVKEVVLYNLYCINLKAPKLNMIDLRNVNPNNELANSSFLTKEGDQIFIWHFKKD